MRIYTCVFVWIILQYFHFIFFMYRELINAKPLNNGLFIRSSHDRNSIRTYLIKQSKKRIKNHVITQRSCCCCRQHSTSIKSDVFCWSFRKPIDSILWWMQIKCNDYVQIHTHTIGYCGNRCGCVIGALYEWCCGCHHKRAHNGKSHCTGNRIRNIHLLFRIPN